MDLGYGRYTAAEPTLHTATQQTRPNLIMMMQMYTQKQSMSGMPMIGKNVGPQRPAHNRVTTTAIFSLKPKTKQETVTSTKKQGKKLDKAAEYKKRQGLGSVIAALDFADKKNLSKSDAELLYDARNNFTGKMTREQYSALRRRVGGTAKDFWKTSIDVKGEYTDKGYVSEDVEPVKGLPFLIVTIMSLFGTLAWVVYQTSS